MLLVWVLKLGKREILMQLQFNFLTTTYIYSCPNLSSSLSLWISFSVTILSDSNPSEVYLYLSPSKFCSRWSCLFSNITAIWIAPVNINALQLHYIYTSSRDRNLFCKWERKYMCVVQCGVLSDSQYHSHTATKVFLSPRNSISSFITPNGSSPRLFLSPSFNIYNDSENISGIWNG